MTLSALVKISIAEFFPGSLYLETALLAIGTLVTLYPLFELHNNQRTTGRAIEQTAWLSAFVALLSRALSQNKEDLWVLGTKSVALNYQPDHT